MIHNVQIAFELAIETVEQMTLPIEMAIQMVERIGPGMLKNYLVDSSVWLAGILINLKQLANCGNLFEAFVQLCSEVGNFNSLQSISVAVSVKLDPRAEQNQRSPASLALQFLPEGYREALAVLSRF